MNSSKCIKCNQEFSDDNIYSSAGWRESKISSLCEKCFDSTFHIHEDDEDYNPEHDFEGNPKETSK